MGWEEEGLKNGNGVGKNPNGTGNEEEVDGHDDEGPGGDENGGTSLLACQIFGMMTASGHD
ncbi:unnamed protein product, partial [Ilex paraguariensis]